MRAYGQKWVKFCKHTDTRGKISSSDELWTDAAPIVCISCVRHPATLLFVSLCSVLLLLCICMLL